MKIVLFDDYQPGLLRGDTVIDLSDSVDMGRDGQETLQIIMSDWAKLRSVFAEKLTVASGVPLTTVKLRAPVPWPSKIMCMAANYREGTDLPPLPLRAFISPPTAILDPGGTVEFPELQIKTWQHEAELVCVIGKRGANVGQSEALDYVFGYTAGVDVSPRSDELRHFAKSFDGHKPIGPCIVTADEIADPGGLDVRLSVDGVLRQNYNTRDMAHPIEECISWFSTCMTLIPGDLLFLGTNHQQLGPLQDGETVEMGIDEIGSFNFHIHDPLKRSWPKEIDASVAAAARRVRRDSELAADPVQ